MEIAREALETKAIQTLMAVKEMPKLTYHKVAATFRCADCGVPAVYHFGDTPLWSMLCQKCARVALHVEYQIMFNSMLQITHGGTHD